LSYGKVKEGNKMADFTQNGVITTLQKLRDRPIKELDRELKTISKKRKMVLLLPALVTEFDTVAIHTIIKELMEVNYLHKIVLSVDQADKNQFKKIKDIMSRLPTEAKIVWNDGARIKALLKELQDADFTLGQPGKGRSVWMSLGYILSDRDVYAIALHDCDIVNYKREMLARLIYPVVHPATDFEFSKGYYARVTDRLYGRVTRLFYTPLIRTMKRILGYNAFIDYLDNFRYALSGEFALLSSLARGIRISPTWGLEVSMLSEVYQKASVNRICQVEIMDTYEHKHQILEKGKPDKGLIRMATDIAKALFSILTQDGMVISESFFRTLLTSYKQESRIAIEKYNALSLLNGLEYDRHTEIEAVDAFVESLKVAMDEFVRDPVGIPMLCAWVRVNAAIPDFVERLRDAVEEDNQK
jgi:glucosyl-3-phosphoglycerate synthase